MSVVDELLNESADRFAAASVGSEVALDTVLALRTLLLALAQPDLDRADPKARTRLEAAIFDSIPAVTQYCRGKLAEDSITFGLINARALVELSGRDWVTVSRYACLDSLRDQLDLCALLADEIDAVHRRREINARGNVLSRLLAIRRAEFATAGDAVIH